VQCSPRGYRLTGTGVREKGGYEKLKQKERGGQAKKSLSTKEEGEGDKKREKGC